MLNKLRQLLLKSVIIRQAVADYKRRANDQQRRNRWDQYFVEGGSIR